MTTSTDRQEPTLPLPASRATHECRACGELKPRAAYYWHGGYRDPRCIECRRRRERAFRTNGGWTSTPLPKRQPGAMSGAQRKAFWDDYKRRQGCSDCGTLDQLQFDHLPGEAKAFTIGQAIRRTAEYSDMQIAAEVAKCDVVCLGCHAKRTGERARGRRAGDFDWGVA